jgi:hypothetical protein
MKQMMWDSFFRDGGWGMYPTSIFGVIFLAASLLYAWKPEKRFVPLLLSLGVVTFASGLLGLAVGTITTFRYVAGTPPPEQHTLTLIGLAESSNNIVLALVVIVISGLLASVGGVRIARDLPANG